MREAIARQYGVTLPWIWAIYTPGTQLHGWHSVNVSESLLAGILRVELRIPDHSAHGLRPAEGNLHTHEPSCSREHQELPGETCVSDFNSPDFCMLATEV